MLATATVMLPRLATDCICVGLRAGRQRGRRGWPRVALGAVCLSSELYVARNVNSTNRLPRLDSVSNKWRLSLRVVGLEVDVLVRPPHKLGAAQCRLRLDAGKGTSLGTLVQVPSQVLLTPGARLGEPEPSCFTFEVVMAVFAAACAGGDNGVAFVGRVGDAIRAP